jgi:hypothetical protein
MRDEREMIADGRFYGWKYPGVNLPTTAKILGAVALPALLYCKYRFILSNPIVG